MTTWLYLLSSAALYVASFLWIKYCWWGTLLFLTPLFYVARYKQLTFVQGFAWGCIVYTAHMSAIWLVCIEYGTGWLRFGAPVATVFWFAILSGLWFILLKTRFIIIRYTATIGFFFFIDSIVLFPFFNCLEGYPFALPLIPLMHGAHLGLLPTLGKIGLLAGLILIQLLYAYQYFIVPIVVTGLLFFTVPIKQQQGDWKDQCIGIAHMWKEQQPYERAQEICHVLIDTIRKHPEKRVVVLPESVFPWPLHEHEYALKMWTDNALEQTRYLILGSYRKNNGKLLNTFYIVQRSRIIFYYDKTHLIPFFEKTNSSPLLKGLNSLFLSTKESFSKSTLYRKWIFRGSRTFTDITPLICSEAFWHMPKNKKAINLVNDAYFRLPYFPRLMRSLAHLNAAEQNTELFYCSWRSNF
ncbi:MAG: apolipoprotein N-acyltransferase [Alteromonas naphthalenivorans]|jgi:apolipoprotein N-acyltransferase